MQDIGFLVRCSRNGEVRWAPRLGSQPQREHGLDSGKRDLTEHVRLGEPVQARSTHRAKVKEMKGLVFELLKKRIVADHGIKAWGTILDQAGLEGGYQTQENYPHQELLTLLEAAKPYTRRTGRDAQRWFGRRAFHQLAGEFYHLFRDHDSTVSFAKAINTHVHPEVRKHYPGAELPVLHLDNDPPSGDLLLRYDSPRGLCSFAEGILEGVGNLYGEKVTIDQPQCVHKGDPHCDLILITEGQVDEAPFETLGSTHRRGTLARRQRG